MAGISMKLLRAARVVLAAARHADDPTPCDRARIHAAMSARFAFLGPLPRPTAASDEQGHIDDPLPEALARARSAATARRCR